MNSNENYNSENDFDYLSSVKNSNCDSESDSDKNDSISSLMQRTSRIINNTNVSINETLFFESVSQIHFSSMNEFTSQSDISSCFASLIIFHVFHLCMK